MFMLIIILGAICLAIGAVGFFATKNKELAEYRDAIVIVCMLAITAVCIFGIFAFDTSETSPVQSVSTDTTQIARATNSSQSNRKQPDAGSTTTSEKNVSGTEGATEIEGALELTSTNVKKPGDVFRDCDMCPEMVVVPAGDNSMGAKKNDPESKPNEYPLAWTHFASHYAVGRYEVTVQEFLKFSSETDFKPSGHCETDGVGSKKTSFANPAFNQGADHPVVCVSIADAKSFTSWLSKKTGEKYTLLSEARWEYARRSVSSAKAIPDEEAREELGNVRGDNWTASTIEVGRYDANDFLIYDMMGNVAEWTTDCWLDNHMLRPKDGRAVLEHGDCTAHAVRGGSWDERADAARPASRRKLNADTRDWRVGFRVMRKIQTPVKTSNLID